MSDNPATKRDSFFRKMMGTRAGVLTQFAIAIVAFLLGMILSGDPESNGSGSTAQDEHAAEHPTTWTCSMHPQIQLPKEGKCPLCFMDLIPLEIDDGAPEGERQLRMSATARELAKIVTRPVVRGSAEIELQLSGKLGYDESRLARITARVAGRLEKLYADNTGMVVASGDRLAAIYSPELLAAQEELIQAARSSASNGGTSSFLKEASEATKAAARNKLRLYGLSDSQIDQIDCVQILPNGVGPRAAY
jgi:Cu(I)/Ag(I) efflux system membrane fusion protein